MTLQTRIESAMRDAMRARDQRRTSTLRMAMAAAKNRATIRKAKNQPYTGISTGNAVADQQIYSQTYTSINKYFDEAVKKVLDVQRFSFGIPASPASAEFKAAWSNAVQRVLDGQQSPAAALNQAQREAVAAIKKAK